MLEINKIYNEDCITGMQKHVEDNSINLAVCDPPFAINGNKFSSMYNRDNSKVIKGYIEIKKEQYPEFTHSWITQIERVLKPGGSVYIFSGYTNLKDVLIELDYSGLKFVNHIIWKYNFGVYTKKKFVTSHYHILYYTKLGDERTFNTYSRFNKEALTENGNKANYKDREDVWNINKEYSRNTIKTVNKLPFELVGKIINYSSNEGDTVLDCFLGSGTTAIVALASKRKFTGFEISKPIFDYAMKQIQENKNNAE